MSEASGAGGGESGGRRRCVAFAGGRRIAQGELVEVAVRVKAAIESGERENVLFFDERTSEPVEVDLRGSQEVVKRRIVGGAGAGEVRGPGRPRLGVVAREVTLLPRHWDWLSEQPGGASVALRRLVEVARRVADPRETVRRAGESVYRFMSAMAGNEQGFEEAARALFGGQRERFETETASWPADIRDHVRWLAREAFEGDKTGAGPASDPARARAGARTARRGRE